jgi:L-serine/L-threonine ammonia-lyase
MEALQPAGSFKVRGMGAACQASKQAGVEFVICASGGNAGYAVAYAGRLLDLKVKIVVPVTTPDRAKDLIKAEGAELEVVGRSWDDAHAYAWQLARKEEATYIHPFDDARVWLGHASIINELAAENIKPGLIVVSVGGGGLLAGLLEGLHAVGWSDVPVLAVETHGAASFATSLTAGKLVKLDRITSIATTLGARQVTPRILEWSADHDIMPWLVTDRQALDACLRFADDHRILVEPACGAALSAVYDRAMPLADYEPIVVIVCGGAGVTRELLDQWDRDVH